MDSGVRRNDAAEGIMCFLRNDGMNSHIYNIVAVATAPGYAGIGIVRISGANLLAIAQTLTGKTEIKTRTAIYCDLYAANGDILDSGLILYFKAPHSFTGEDVLEIQGHGSPVVLQMLVKRCLELGCRLALPGEFSRRAYLNGKLDLLQAESIIDLIHAESESGAKGALQSLKGTFSKHVHAINQRLIDLRMFVEASIDFPEEDIEFIATAKIKTKLEVVQQEINKLLANTRQGVLLNNGANVVIIGRPNVGKSSILNVLANEEIAIVTDIAGTTRDTIKEKVIVNGIALNIIDTAGIRDTQDVVEKIGIERAIDALNNAALCLIIVDATIGITPDDEMILAKIPAEMPRLVVHNKIDLVNTIDQVRLPVKDQAVIPDKSAVIQDLIRDPFVDRNSATDYSASNMYISAKNNLGIDELRSAILQAVGYDNNKHDIFIARTRHLDAMLRAVTHIDYAFANWNHLELIAEELRYAQNNLNEITGEFTSDDLLGEIFSRFCIGK